MIMPWWVTATMMILAGLCATVIGPEIGLSMWGTVALSTVFNAIFQMHCLLWFYAHGWRPKC